MVERNCEGTLLKKRTRGEKEAATYDEGRKERKKITCLILNAGCAALVRTHNTHYTHLLVCIPKVETPLYLWKCSRVRLMYTYIVDKYGEMQ